MMMKWTLLFHFMIVAVNGRAVRLKLSKCILGVFYFLKMEIIYVLPGSQLLFDKYNCTLALTDPLGLEGCLPVIMDWSCRIKPSQA